MTESHTAVVEKKRRQQELLNFLKASGVLNEALELVGIPKSTYFNWRSMDSQFKELSDQALAIGKQARRLARIDEDDIYDPARAVAERPDFETFRRDYIGRPVANWQKPMIEAWMDKTNQIVFVLAPTGAGKDTTAGDIVLYESLARDKRVAWVMENADQSKKRLRRLERYFWDETVYDLAPGGPDTSVPTKTLMNDFGLFKWNKNLRFPDGGKPASTTWTAEQLYFLGRDNEADPNIWATGMTGAIYGSRIDVGVVSDPFTKENQYSPTERTKQLDWLEGTFLSRLDDEGRVLFLGTRVDEMDNWGTLLERWIENARVAYQDGYYTKYDNGIATVIIPGIQTDADGEEISFWPEKFPLDDYFENRLTGDVLKVDDVPIEEHRVLGGKGYRRRRGLRGIRESRPTFFWSSIQQQPPSSGVGEFPATLLDHCDDFTRSWGVRKPGSTLVLGIDPARSAGAAWVMLEWDGEDITVIDDFYGENIGAHGLREKLLVEPITRWFPKYAVYESNREASVLEHPQVIDAAKNSRTEIVPFTTHAHNRGIGELRVAAISLDMATGLIKFPAATAEDRARSQKLKEHFQNWDMKQKTRVATGNLRQYIPDDRAMAFWVAWVQVKKLGGRGGRLRLPQPKVPDITRRRWGYATKQDKEPNPQVPTDLVALYYGQNEGSS